MHRRSGADKQTLPPVAFVKQVSPTRGERGVAGGDATPLPAIPQPLLVGGTDDGMEGTAGYSWATSSTIIVNSY